MSNYTVEQVNHLIGLLGATVKTTEGIIGMITEVDIHSTGCARVDVTRSVLDLDKLGKKGDSYHHMTIDISQVELVKKPEVDPFTIFRPIDSKTLNLLGATVKDSLTGHTGELSTFYFNITGSIRVGIKSLSTDTEQHPVPELLHFVYPLIRIKVIEQREKVKGLDTLLPTAVATADKVDKKPLGGPATSRTE